MTTPDNQDGNKVPSISFSNIGNPINYVGSSTEGAEATDEVGAAVRAEILRRLGATGAENGAEAARTQEQADNHEQNERTPISVQDFRRLVRELIGAYQADSGRTVRGRIDADGSVVITNPNEVGTFQDNFNWYVGLNVPDVDFSALRGNYRFVRDGDELRIQYIA